MSWWFVCPLEWAPGGRTPGGKSNAQSEEGSSRRNSDALGVGKEPREGSISNAPAESSGARDWPPS